MANEQKFYVFCGNNCKYEAMTKEQILTAITQAVETGEIKDVDTGFITRIVEQNKGVALYFWVGTQAEYNALETKADDCRYIITDDTTKEELATAIMGLTQSVETLQQKQNKIGAVLYESDTGAAAEQTITFDANGFNLFAVTLKSGVNEVVVIGGKTTAQVSGYGIRTRIIASNKVLNDMGAYEENYADIMLSNLNNNNNHTVLKARCMSFDGKITKIVGYM